jgi:ABC-2 type transport system ATP-binding protein
MWDFMREINAAGTTIILTTHYLEEAESLCRNVAIIDEGRIIENDSMKNVIGKLQLEVFVLTLQEPLQTAPQLTGYAVKLRNEHEIEVEVMKGQGLNDVFAQLSAQRLHVTSMRTKSNRLEELFIRLVDKQERQSA